MAGSRSENISIDSTTPVETAQIWAEALGWRIAKDGNNDEVALLLSPDNAEAELVPDILFLRVPEDRGVKYGCT